MKRVNQSTTGSRRQRDANSDEASNQGQDDNDSQEEAGSTEHAYILISILAWILESYSKKISFSICLTAPSKNDYIHHKLQRAETHQDILTINSTKKRKFQKRDVARSVHSAEEALSFIVDLGKSAVIDLPNLVNIKRSKHATDLRKMLKNERQPHNTQYACFGQIVKCQELGQHNANLLDEYEGVFGIDLGETWTADAFYLPTDTEHQPGVQHTIRRDELYGREPINRKWLENRNEQSSINNIQCDLAKSGGSKTSNVANFLTFIRTWQAEAGALDCMMCIQAKNFIVPGIQKCQYAQKLIRHGNGSLI
ncbi:hypothetical protein BDC45DRAFT_504716 [Circinella umbellata]|nr:hypothetical protein BDC45DRAFT_504716 [Circinella umbellata]